MSSSLNNLDNVDYSYGFLKSFRWIIGLIILVVGIIVSYIPFKQYIDDEIHKNLTAFCPTAKMKDYHVEFFAPKLVVEGTHIPAPCIGNFIPGGLRLDEIKLYFTGVSFSPFGVSSTLATEVLGNKIEAKIVAGLGSVSVMLESEIKDGIPVSDINRINFNNMDFIPYVKINGDAYISKFIFSTNYGAVQLGDLTINITSKNLNLPAQNIFGFGFDQMPINNLLIHIVGSGKSKLLVQKFILGDENSPIKANVLGDINLNLKNLPMSPVNLKVDLNLSEEFLGKNEYLVPILGMFNKENNEYKIQLKGLLGSVQPTSQPIDK